MEPGYATGPLGRLIDPVRSWVLRQAAWLAVVSSGALGASVFFGRSPFLALPMILLGWLAAWGSRRVVWLALVGSAGGLAVGALYVVVDGRKLLLGPWLATVAVIAVVVVLIAWKLAKSAAPSPRTGLQLLTQPEPERGPSGEPRSIGPAP